MKVSKAVNVTLNNEDLEALQNGEPLQIPIDEQQGIVIYPPTEINDG